MDSDLTARVLYFGLLLLALGGYAVAQLLRRPGQTAQQMLIWAFIFIGLMGAAGLWQDISREALGRQTVLEGGRIEAPLAPDGHYYLSAQINGTPVRFMVDTGASDIVLTRRDAERVGLDPDSLSYFGQARTANGTVATAPVVLKTLALGPIQDENLRAVVNGGEMDHSLMGMAYLTRFARVELRRDRLLLER